MKHIQVDNWVKLNEGGFYKIDRNKNIYVDFDKYLGTPNVYKLNAFILSRDSFKNRAPKTCGYSNYYLKYYNTDDDFIHNLLLLKFLTEDKKSKLKIKSFIRLIKEYIITENAQKDIKRMVEDNYLYILDKNNPLKNMTHKKGRSDDYYRYQIISDKMGKRIMCAVVAIDLIFPLIVNYTYVRNKKSDDLFQYFTPFLDMFSDGNEDILQKLSMYTWSVVSIHYSKNKKMWNHRSMLGDMGKEQFYDLCLRKHIITDSLPWLVFDNNMGSFFQKILQEQLGYYIRNEYETMPVELKTTKEDTEGYSDMEKFESQLFRFDESLLVVSEENIPSVINSIKSRFNMYISKEEIEFYTNNIHFSKDQHRMINYHFAKYFNGYRDLKLISEETFVELAIIMRIKLIGQGMTYLPYILTGNLKKKGIPNRISTAKIIEKVVETKYYKEMMKSKFGFLVDCKKYNPILKLLRSIISSRYTYVVYDDELNGEDIEFNIEILVYEFLQFIDQI